jgi:hypothetical protein
MKTFPAVVLGAAVMVCLAATAQTAPKLALAGVAVAPTLAEKNHSPNAPAATSPSAPLDLTGVWNGDTHSNRKAFPFVLTVTKAADGAQYAELKNIKRGNDYHSTSVSCRDNHVTVTFADGGGSQFLDGRYDATNNRLVMLWNSGGGRARLVLQRSELMSSSVQTGGTVAPVVSLDAITHALEMQLADRFGAEHLFTVLEGDDLDNAVPRPENHPYNLKDAATAEGFRKAGVRYLLVTTLEDMKNETVDRAQGRVGYQTDSGSSVGVSENSRREKARAAAHAELATQGKFDAHRVIDQNVYLLVRCRLFDAGTGELLDSASHTFTTNRTYVALAAGTKEVSASDLFETAARVLANRIVIREREALYPIAVLEKEGKEITLNCGSDAGLKAGQVLNVYAVGKELKDPVTGEALGHDEQFVGRVSISQLQPKFAKAKVWEDNGIVTGNILRREQGN